MAQNQDFSGFVFLDIETTGLDPHDDEILEIGIVLYDDKLQELDAKNWVIITEDSKSALRKTLAGNSEGERYVAEMHRKNGLASEILGADLVEGATEATKRWYMLDIIEWLEERGAVNQPMCGASIGSLDRPFLRHHMPELESTFHYRSLDVSSFRVFVQKVNPELWYEISIQTDRLAAEMYGNGGHGAEHRALADARYSALLADEFWSKVGPTK